MADLISDVIAYLIANGHAVAAKKDIFKDYMPSEPDTTIVVVYEYSGRGARPGIYPAVSRSLQVVVRSPKNDPDAGRAKIWQIYNFLSTPLEEVHDITITRWGILHARGTPSKLKVDERGRTHFSFNMSVVTYRD